MSDRTSASPLTTSAAWLGAGSRKSRLPLHLASASRALALSPPPRSVRASDHPSAMVGTGPAFGTAGPSAAGSIRPAPRSGPIG